MIEAMACGLPVAAYPATGPLDVVTRPELGSLHEDLRTAVLTAQKTGVRAACVAEASRYTWESCTHQFVGNLVPTRVASTGLS
jgi:glycosyltransferase involved in cell wall biosynthesis